MRVHDGKTIHKNQVRNWPAVMRLLETPSKSVRRFGWSSSSTKKLGKFFKQTGFLPKNLTAKKANSIKADADADADAGNLLAIPWMTILLAESIFMRLM
jgi:hypothetical protein